MSAPEERRVKSLAELPEAIEPPHELWPGIEARLKERLPARSPAPAPRPHLPQLRWLAAAAMVASVAVGVWIGRDLMPSSATPLQVAQTQPLKAAPAAVDAGAREAAFINDPRYQRQREELLQSLQARLDAMPPAARAKVTASLATIETAKKDLESALGKDPSNALLQELLINTYQDEMRALTDVHEASDPGRGI